MQIVIRYKLNREIFKFAFNPIFENRDETNWPVKAGSRTNQHQI